MGGLARVSGPAILAGSAAIALGVAVPSLVYALTRGRRLPVD
jgi:hypothetical protein